MARGEADILYERLALFGPSREIQSLFAELFHLTKKVHPNARLSLLPNDKRINLVEKFLSQFIADARNCTCVFSDGPDIDGLSGACFTLVGHDRFLDTKSGEPMHYSCRLRPTPRDEVLPKIREILAKVKTALQGERYDEDSPIGKLLTRLSEGEELAPHTRLHPG